MGSKEALQGYAVVETGGKQYRVTAGDRVMVERLAGDVGATIELAPVLALSDGKDLRVGAPDVDGAKVTAEVLEHRRGPKLVAFKKKRRKGYARKIGHRQELTVLKIRSIG